MPATRDAAAFDFTKTYAATGTVPFHGDRVISSDTGKYAGLGTVTKVNTKTIAVRLDNGLPVKFPFSMIAPAPADAPPAPAADPSAPRFLVGSVVRFNDANGKRRFGTHLFVVVKDNGDIVNVVRLGGDAANPLQYIRASKRGLDIVALADLAASL